ncbi:uncharacterized protein METZ01_LOCUS140300, partial [marine metagenome]
VNILFLNENNCIESAKTPICFAVLVDFIH